MKIKHIYTILAATGLLVACSTSKKATKEVVEEVKAEIFDEKKRFQSDQSQLPSC